MNLTSSFQILMYSELRSYYFLYLCCLFFAMFFYSSILSISSTWTPLISSSRSAVSKTNRYGALFLEENILLSAESTLSIWWFVTDASELPPNATGIWRPVRWKVPSDKATAHRLSNNHCECSFVHVVHCVRSCYICMSYLKGSVGQYIYIRY